MRMLCLTMVVGALAAALTGCAVRVVTDPQPDARLVVGVCVGASPTHATGSRVQVALLDATGAPTRPVGLTVPGTAEWAVTPGSYAVSVDGQRVGTVTASATAAESLGMGVGCPAPTTTASP